MGIRITAEPTVEIFEQNNQGYAMRATWDGSAATPPTTASVFGIGCVLTNALTGVMYRNTGTVASPSWDTFTEIGRTEIADDAVNTDKLDPTTIQYAEVSLSNTNMLALRATPITLVAAPGAGKMIEFIKAWAFFDWTADYSETADNMALLWGAAGSAASETIEATGFVDAGADKAIEVAPRASAVIAKAAIDNKALVIHNTGDGEYGGGNAANVIRVKVAYRIHSCGW